MNKAVLYLGDTELTGAGSYLAGVMSFYNIGFDYLASDEKFSDNLLGNNYSAIIVSDYPAGNFTAEQLERIAEQVRGGVGLLMIGGWESFTGQNREYTDTILKDVLPVVMALSDDRVNCSGPCLVEKGCGHAIINNLPFDENPPAIGGYNKFAAKPDATTVLLSRRFEVARQGGDFTFGAFDEADPLLVLGSYGRGRVATLATDAAPHWVGPLVDWGPPQKRIQAHATGAEAIEVGCWYAELFANLINWTMGRL